MENRGVCRITELLQLFYKASMDVAIEDMQKAAQIKIGGGKNGNH